MRLLQELGEYVFNNGGGDMKNALGVLLFVAGVQSAHASCSGNQIEKMVDRGFTKDEIKALCLDTAPKPKGKSEEKDPGIPAGFTTTCRFNSGPKEGTTQTFRPGTRGITPILIGGSCTDGMNSWGVAIADKKQE